jgi:hypothetical protein
MRLAGLIFRIITMGASGAGAIALLTWWTETDTSMMHDAFSYDYCYFSAVLAALVCGLLGAMQINDYLHPESE